MKNFSLKTKVNYRQNSRRRIVGIGILALLSIFVFFTIGRGIVSFVFSFVITPVYHVREYMETSGATIPVFIRSRLELADQIKELEEGRVSQQGLRNSVTMLTEENKLLRTLLHASSTDRIAAGVIGRPPYTPYDTVILDQGSNDGVVQYAPVYSGGTQVIGYVREVFPHSALVTLLSSHGVETTVFVFGPNIFTTAYGEGSGVLRLSIPQGIPVQKGDVVITPSIDSGIIGSIEEVQSIPTEPEQHAYVSFDVPLQSLRVVAVGTIPLTKTTYEDALTQVSLEHADRLKVEIPSGVETDLKALFGSSTASSTIEETGSSTEINTQ